MLIFISHANANANLARLLAETLERLGARTFLASRPGDIRGDENWMASIERALQKADAYIILLTPESVLRPWVNYEAGAAWSSGKLHLYLRVQALAHKEIPLPISSKQIYTLEDAEQFCAVLDTLGLPKNDIADISARFASEAAQAVSAGENEPTWEGVSVGGVYYAWAGPLLNLQDFNDIPPPPELFQEIEKRGLRARWGIRNHLSHHVRRGLAQVFATDREKWRRPVTDKSRILLVGKDLRNKGLDSWL